MYECFMIAKKVRGMFKVEDLEPVMGVLELHELDAKNAEPSQFTAAMEVVSLILSSCVLKS